MIRTIKLNGHDISKVIIEIDHINYGINKRTNKLNKTKRTNFTVKQIEKFILMLDGGDQAALSYKKGFSRFAIRIDCPIKGKFYDKEFLMIFITNNRKTDCIHTVTLIPNWKR